MLVMQNFELAPRSVPNKSYEARRKLRPLIEVLRYQALSPPFEGPGYEATPSPPSTRG